MKVSVLKEKNIFNIEEQPKPILASKGAIVKVVGCGLCGSDIVKMNTNKAKAGSVLGHEIVGIIEEIDTTTSFKKGDKIVMGHHVPCFECQFCRGESYSMCPSFKAINIVPGGFSEYIFITETHLENTVCKVPDGMDDVVASFCEPLSCCVRAVKRAGVVADDSVLIVGLGSIGILMGQVAKAYGAKVIGCDLLQERLDIAKKLGFDEVIKFENNEETSQKIKEKMNTSYGIDKVILTAGNDSSIDFSLSSVRDGGVVLVFSSIKSNDKGFLNNEIYYRELTIKSSYSPSPVDIHEAFELLKNKKVKVDNISVEYPLAGLGEAVEDFVSNKILKAYIKI